MSVIMAVVIVAVVMIMAVVIVAVVVVTVVIVAVVIVAVVVVTVVIVAVVVVAVRDGAHAWFSLCAWWCRGTPSRECSAWKIASDTNWLACSFASR